MKRTRFIDELMAEVIVYGGLPVRRSDVYADALKRLSSDPRSTPATAKRWADNFAFGPHTRLAPEGLAPLTTAELDALP